MGKLIFLVSGGVSEPTKTPDDMPVRLYVKQAYQSTMESIGLRFEDGSDIIDGTVASYAPMMHQPDTATMMIECLGLSPKPLIRIDHEGSAGGICFQEAVRQILSEEMDICLACAWESTLPGSIDKSRPTYGNATSEHMAKVMVKNMRTGTTFACTAFNLSTAGAYIEFELGSLRLNDWVRLIVPLSQIGKTHILRAQIAWIKNSHFSHRSAGIRFIKGN